MNDKSKRMKLFLGGAALCAYLAANSLAELLSDTSHDAFCYISFLSALLGLLACGIFAWKNRP